MTKLVAKAALNNTALGGLSLLLSPTKTQFEDREKDGFVAELGDAKLNVGGEDFGYLFGKPRPTGTVTAMKYVSLDVTIYKLSDADVSFKELLQSNTTTGSKLFFTGDDLLIGSIGIDTFSAGAGDDTLKGRAGADTLLGQGGKDILEGGDGIDRLDGGGGKDTYVFKAAAATGIDTIVKFQAGEKIHIAAKTFAGLTEGKLADEAFAIGTEAADADDRFIYDPATGALYHDPDGASGAAQVQIAAMQKNLVDFDAHNFIVI